MNCLLIIEKLIKRNILPCHFLTILSSFCWGFLVLLHIHTIQFCRNPFLFVKMFIILCLNLVTLCFFCHSSGFFLFLSPQLFSVNHSKLISILPNVFGLKFATHNSVYENTGHDNHEKKIGINKTHFLRDRKRRTARSVSSRVGVGGTCPYPGRGRWYP